MIKGHDFSNYFLHFFAFCKKFAIEDILFKETIAIQQIRAVIQIKIKY